VSGSKGSTGLPGLFSLHDLRHCGGVVACRQKNGAIELVWLAGVVADA
jgi:hypothetical protein